MKASKVAGIVASLLSATACGGPAVRSYAMPVAAGTTTPLTDPLMACATQRGLTPNKTEHGVTVQLDATASAEYTMEANKPTSMNVLLSKDAAKGDAEAAFNAAKSKGDELWTCATTPPTALTGTCGQLNSCYSEVTTSLCSSDDAHCKETFSIKPGMDEASCKAAMGSVASNAEPLKANKPNWTLPSSCASAAPATAAAAQEPAPTPVASISGDWMVSVAYKWSCAQGKKAAKTGNDKGSWTMKVAGNGADISGEMKGKKASYSMSGNGSPTTVHLCGSMPLNGHGSQAANRDAKVCITADRSGDSKSYKGKAEGSYTTEKGASCKLLSAEVELSQ